MITMTITLKFVISITMMIIGDNHHDYKVVLISGLMEQFCAQVNRVLIWEIFCSSFKLWSKYNAGLDLWLSYLDETHNICSQWYCILMLLVFQCPPTLVSLWAQTFKYWRALILTSAYIDERWYWRALILWCEKILFWQLVSTCDIQVIVKHKMQRVLWNTH